ncbi:MAG: AMP-binding protein [Candidatus Omnitrophica bacterium]|nr:AMP-binding protein [Candidatus Omnitrophota bacterium]
MINKMVKTVLENLTIMNVLEAINKKYGNATALRVKKKDGSLKEISFTKLGRRTVTISSALINLGINKNDRVGILSENRPEWVLAFFGIISCAGAVVPLDTKLSESEIQFILNDSQTKCVFVSEKYLPVIDSLKAVLPHLEHVILLDGSKRRDLILLKKLILHKGKERYQPIYPEDTAVIVYTSGTTGVAKGVELSYKNLLFQVLAFSEILHCSTSDSFLSILPLNHMLEITGGLIAPLYMGSSVTYADSLKTTSMLALMKETKTTAMISAPLVLKMFHTGIMRKASMLPPAKRNAFNAALSLSRALLKMNVRVGKILFGEIHKEFGGRFRGFISGGAPLNYNIEVDLNAMGFRILQGYGLTETAPVVTVNTFEHNKFGSVGRPLPGGVEIKIVKSDPNADGGEIITRGPHLMKGYYLNPKKTEEAIKDGWFYTGDLGYLDKDGFLYIQGRLKNMIVLGAGKKVFPEEVEAVMEKSPYVKEIFVLGRIAHRGIRKGHEEVYAVVVPDLDRLKKEDLKSEERIKKLLKSEIERLNKNLAQYKWIVDFKVRYSEFPRTSTRKIRRKTLEDAIKNNNSL